MMVDDEGVLFLGVQVQLKEYDFLCQMKKHATFLEDDILNIFPVVKHVSPKATDAVAVFEAAQGRLQAGKYITVYNKKVSNTLLEMLSVLGLCTSLIHCFSFRHKHLLVIKRTLSLN